MRPRGAPAVDAIARVATRREGLLRAAVRRGVLPADAEDAVQEGLVRALSRVEQVRDVDRAEAWVARVVQNVVVDRLRAPRVATPSTDLDALPTQPEDPSSCDCVITQMHRLPGTHAEVLRLAVVEGLALEEVAGQLGITKNTATVRLHRARGALRERLARHCGTTSLRGCDDCGCVERGCCAAP